MSPELDYYDDNENPLDNVEDVLNANNWVFDRMNDDELVVEVSGRSCGYKLFFIWQEDMNALQFCCQYDFTIEKNNLDQALKVLSSLNENLWMGHFEIPEQTSRPAFRHTCLLRGLSGGNSANFIEDLVDISLAQCERHFAAFHLLASANLHAANDQTMSLALMETVGRS